MEQAERMHLMARLAERLCSGKLRLATAESCTGGLIGHWITEWPGASTFYVGGVTAYANKVKESLLGVPQETLEAHGAVSEATVLAMASGACFRLGADVGVAVSGVAGPGGGSAEKPVGTVWIGWSVGGEVSARGFLFAGDRSAVKRAAAAAALTGLLGRL